MFQFRRFPRCTYFEFQYNVLRYEPEWVSSFRNLRINAYLQLPEAYRSLSRLSSAPSAKAFALRPCSLDHIKLISFEIGLYPLDSLLPTKIMLPFLLKLQYFLKRTYYNLCFAVIIQFSRYVFEFPFQGPQNRTISNQLVSITCSRNKSSSMFYSCLTP